MIKHQMITFFLTANFQITFSQPRGKICQNNSKFLSRPLKISNELKLFICYKNSPSVRIYSELFEMS